MIASLALGLELCPQLTNERLKKIVLKVRFPLQLLLFKSVVNGCSKCMKWDLVNLLVLSS